MYILVNQDLKIQKGKLAGQVGHAVSSYLYKIYKKGEEQDKLMIDEYMKSFQKKIVLRAPRIFLEMMERKGYVSVRDEGLTALDPNTLTCVNLGIVDLHNIPEDIAFVKDMKLLN